MHGITGIGDFNTWDRHKINLQKINENTGPQRKCLCNKSKCFKKSIQLKNYLTHNEMSRCTLHNIMKSPTLINLDQIN